MREFLLDQALRRLAAEAATHFSAMVAEGEQIPFDVAADGAEDSLFYSYVPLTGGYVAEHASELRSLPGFGTARDAIVEAGVAAAYLEGRGEIVPPDPGARAERMLEVFFTSLWEGSTGFALDRDRLDEAFAGLDAEARSADDADVLIAPLIGLRMSTERLQLPNGIRIVRADTIEAPIDAMRSEGMGRAAWEPQFLAVAELRPGENAKGALRQLQELISVMRLFKGGGIGLGPYAFAPTGEENWRRISTAAGAPRPGGYRLAEEDGAALSAFAETLESRPDPDSALTWAVGRFEMGCERESAMEGLSDHLLALRAVLEGGGPIGASLSMRAAALIADRSLNRVEARERVEEALELERALMNGRIVENAIELSTWVEEGARRLLRQAALGELGDDLSTIADETLIANGLEGGDADITVSTDFSELDSDDDLDFDVEGEIASEAGPTPDYSPRPAIERSGEDFAADAPEPEFPGEEDGTEETRILEPIPAEGEIKITATHWLDEVSEGGQGDSLEWPAATEKRELQHRERIDTPRVRHLFPVPDSDWDVSHLEYEHFGKRGRTS